MGLVNAYMIEKGALGGADAIFGMQIAFTYHNAYDHI